MKKPLARAGIIGLTAGALGCGDPREASPLRPAELFRGGRVEVDSLRGAGWRRFLEPVELHRAWAPPDGPWRPFHKPTLVAAVAAVREAAGPVHGPVAERAAADAEAFLARFELPPNAAFIIDLEHEASVVWSMTLARRGRVPVLTMNNWPHQAGLVRLERTLGSLIYHAAERAALSFPADARPAFVLDRARLSPKSVPNPRSVFDNRYFHTSSDLPETSLLQSRQVTQVFYVNPKGVAAGAEEDDLSEIFASWAKAGIRFDYITPAADGTLAHGQPVPATRATMFSTAALQQYDRERGTGTYHRSYHPVHLWHLGRTSSSWSGGTWGSPSSGTRSFSSGSS